jgi:hypothetical protein
MVRSHGFAVGCVVRCQVRRPLGGAWVFDYPVVRMPTMKLRGLHRFHMEAWGFVAGMYAQVPSADRDYWPMVGKN